MSAYDIILKRRSIRKFTDQKISDETVECLMKAAMAGPSACNKQPWEFFVIRNPEIRVKLAQSAPYAKMDSSLIIVVAGNIDRALTPWINDFWIQDCSAAVENILLTATELGIGTCWCGLYPQEEIAKNVRNILGAAENVIPLALIHLGYPDQEVPERTQYNPEFVHIL